MGEAVRMFDVLDLTSLGQNGRICSCLPQAVACGGCVRYGLESSWFLLPRSVGRVVVEHETPVARLASGLVPTVYLPLPQPFVHRRRVNKAPRHQLLKGKWPSRQGKHMRFSGQPTPTPSSGRIRWPRPYRFPLPHQSSASEPPPFSARAARGP
jgi:hypothetical protein